MQMAFTRLAAFVLLVTAIAKLWSVFQGSRLLDDTDPLIQVPFTVLLLIAAALELCVMAICLFRPTVNGLVAVVWLCSLFLSYRIGLWWVGWQKPCSCLGNLTDALHISPQLADNIMKGLLAFMLLGSISLLILHRRSATPAKPEEASSTPAVAS
jgi:glucan phosphoethanolaminetransferase (alkaline phosphatase superfamily)